MTPAELILWFRRDSRFADTARGVGEFGYGFAHASTEEVATALGIDPKEAYRLLSAAKRKGLIAERKERVKLRGRRGPNMGEKQVGWALWELDLTQEDWEYRERKSGRMEPNAKSPAIHYRDPVTDKRICNTRLMRESSTTEPYWSELPEHRRCVRCVAELKKRRQTPNVSHPKYAIDYVLGRDKYTLVIEAEDRDEAYRAARNHLVQKKLFSASLQGSARVATQDDVDAAERRR